MNPMAELPIICGGTHYYAQHFLFPPAQMTLDRSKSIGPASKSKNTKWRPQYSLDDLLDTLERNDERFRNVAHRIRVEPGVREYLDTFYLPEPTYPPTWIQREESPPRPSGKQETIHTSTLSDQQLLAQHRLLELVDEPDAGRWHWRDGRKVKRGLERWWEGVETMRQDSEGRVSEVETESRDQAVSRPR